MKLYKTTVISIATVNGVPNTKQTTVTWNGTQSDASAVRAAAVRDGAKRKDVETEAVDVPTDKAGLLEFLNARGVV